VRATVGRDKSRPYGKAGTVAAVGTGMSLPQGSELSEAWWEETQANGG
jgi:hypothetical protein